MIRRLVRVIPPCDEGDLPEGGRGFLPRRIGRISRANGPVAGGACSDRGQRPDGREFSTTSLLRPRLSRQREAGVNRLLGPSSMAEMREDATASLELRRRLVMRTSERIDRSCDAATSDCARELGDSCYYKQQAAGAPDASCRRTPRCSHNHSAVPAVRLVPPTRLRRGPEQSLVTTGRSTGCADAPRHLLPNATSVRSSAVGLRATGERLEALHGEVCPRCDDVGRRATLAHAFHARFELLDRHEVALQGMVPAQRQQQKPLKPLLSPLSAAEGTRGRLRPNGHQYALYDRCVADRSLPHRTATDVHVRTSQLDPQIHGNTPWPSPGPGRGDGCLPRSSRRRSSSSAWANDRSASSMLASPIRIHAGPPTTSRSPVSLRAAIHLLLKIASRSASAETAPTISSAVAATSDAGSCSRTEVPSGTTSDPLDVFVARTGHIRAGREHLGRQPGCWARLSTDRS